MVFLVKVKLHAAELHFSLIMSLFKDIFQGFCKFQGFLTRFWRLGKHLFGGIPQLMIVCAYSGLINVSTALFLERKKTLRHNEKASSWNGWKTDKGALSGLRQFLATESPLKIMKNIFYFISKAILVLKIFKFLSWLFGNVSKQLD